MHDRPRTRLVAYGAALLAPAVTLLVQWPLWPVQGDRVLYMAFFPAVLIAAYLGGLWPGLLATCLSALAATYFLVDPPYSLAVTTVPDAVALSIFVLCEIYRIATYFGEISLFLLLLRSGRTHRERGEPVRNRKFWEMRS